MLELQFSIITPTYNRANIIERAIDSLISQTFKSWELIVIDDGSKDDTLSRLCRYSSNEKIKILQQTTNSGPGAARNKAIQQAKGNYLTFLDSDDYYRPNHLEYHAQEISKDPLVDLFYGGVKIIGETEIIDLENPGKMISLHDCALAGTFFIKREVMNKVGGFPVRGFGEDFLLFQELKRQRFNIKKLSLPTYVYDRSLPDEITKNFYKKEYGEGGI
ncbi:MAG: glycosyltransferase family 2 protein [Nanoarchaeota archaeon]|nr:glycosyltransferase family 2 protein [Nanoarchaeota archaeon]MBU1643982.1 glycosyltransferase family 2 protein [Nanoarchaeota archaeon]MBU1977077.1 glycosyltransferase family 2 protein [Nanoarchaeota archaeon]